MASLLRLEVWSDLQCASGTRQAIIPLDQVVRLVDTVRTTRDDEGTLELSKEVAAVSALDMGAVIRYVYDDGSFDEWRIGELEDTSRTSRFVRCSLQSPLLDLNVKAAPVSSTSATVTTLATTFTNKTPAQHAATFITFAPTYFAVGTITPTVVVDVTVSGYHPLRAFRALVDAIRAKGVDCELDYRRNGTTGYYLDIVTSIGSGIVDVRTAKNLLETVRTRTLARQASSVTVLGSTGVRRSTVAATTALGFWKVASVSGSDVELRGAEGCPDPIAYDDQFNGAYLEKTDGTLTQITDTVASTQKVTVASAASVSANQRLRLVKDSTGNDLTTVVNPTATAPRNQSQVLTLSGRTDRTNWAVNPIFANWTAGAPDDWTETDALGYMTVSQETTTYLYGASSAKCVIAQPGGAGIAAASLASRSMAVAPSATSRSWTASVWIYVDKSLSTGTPNGNFRLVLGGTTTSTTYAAVTSQTWTRLDATATMTGATVTALLRYDAGSNAAQGLTYYIGGMLLEELASAQASMVVGSEPAFSLAAANRYLRLYSVAPVAYRVAFADLQSWDATAFPYDTVTLGATANVRDTDLSIITSGRIIELTRDRRNPLASAVTVANRPVDLISSLTGLAAI